MTGTDPDVEDAARVVAAGGAVVYPTETVYGLGADALSPDAVDLVYDIKGRPRTNPLSLGSPDVDAALEHVRPTDREERFMRAFLPGPVTVVVERGPEIPDGLTAGRDRVGVRVPAHDRARALLRACGPLTATSANLSGEGSITRPEELPPAVRDRVGAVLDDGETPGTESTVVDPGEGVIHRRGARADEVEAWLRD